MKRTRCTVSVCPGRVATTDETLDINRRFTESPYEKNRTVPAFVRGHGLLGLAAFTNQNSTGRRMLFDRRVL
jgi:hypothetical protein